MSRLFILILLLFTGITAYSQPGYRLWLRYDKINDTELLKTYRPSLAELVFPAGSPTLVVAKEELVRGLTGLTGRALPESETLNRDGALLAGTPGSLGELIPAEVKAKLEQLPEGGFVIESIQSGGKSCILIASGTEAGVLYGAFRFLRLLQTHRPLQGLSIQNAPRITHRVLNHWDNLDGTVERGYAGFSLWNWHKLPDYLDPRYTDYARANASAGINGTVVNNVNANALFLTRTYLEKLRALAGVFRPYGIKVYLSARFSAPMEIGGLETADPLDPEVREWWKKKADEIYSIIPDFGGFLVKANSEGQPGPQDYGRSHAEGANMLAGALQPHGGIVMWRAFVYDDQVPGDRAKQAYSEFKPLDGQFRDNVLVQVKNGPIDFQPREPFHPLFGAMPETPLMMEFQITQEYLGFSTHLVYLAPLFKECLNADTYAAGKGSTVARVIDGSLDRQAVSGIAGVANTGTDLNWCGHPFAQANWYAFGRLAWDHTLTAEEIAEDWIRMTFTNNPDFVEPVKSMMLASRETTVSYMTPLGLHHIMGWGHHYGPAPWIRDKPRADWTSVYYHQADSAGIGFDRTATGSDALSQYFPPVRARFENPDPCPDTYLLWFHHLSWDYKMKSGRTLWEALVRHYYQGADAVKEMQRTWDRMEGMIDPERFRQVKQLLAIQAKEARWWRDACLLYFQTFSKRPIPTAFEKPSHTLDHYQQLQFPAAPGN